MAHPIIPYLGELVKRYILSGNLAAKSFAKDVGVPYMVVYRLTRGHQKSVSFFQAKKILKRIEPEKYLETLGRYFPDETKELLSKGPAIEDSSDELLELVDYAFSDFDNYRVFNFATESLGARREDVAAEFGRLGLEIVDDMIERKAIRVREDGTYQSMLSDVNVWDEDISIGVCQNNLRLFSSIVPGSYLRNWALGLNNTGVKKYYEAHTNFVKSLKELEDDPTLRGGHVMFSSVVTGQLHCPKEESEGNKI